MCTIDQPHFKDDDSAFAYLEGIRWPNGPICPHCGTINHAYALKNHRYRCAEKVCRKDFTVRVGTVFEDSPIKLHKWLLAAYLVCSSKKGISSHQLHRMLGVTYKTAWFMSHRLREAMNMPAEGKLGGDGGPVEVDETYWGNNGKQKPGARGGDHKMKTLPKKSLIYLDPPYFVKGQELYQNHYDHSDHQAMARLVTKQLKHPWIVSYDHAPEIVEMYRRFPMMEYGINYSAQDRYRGAEVMFFSKGLTVPDVDNPARMRAAA